MWPWKQIWPLKTKFDLEKRLQQRWYAMAKKINNNNNKNHNNKFRVSQKRLRQRWYAEARRRITTTTTITTTNLECHKKAYDKDGMYKQE